MFDCFVGVWIDKRALKPNMKCFQLKQKCDRPKIDCEQKVKYHLSILNDFLQFLITYICYNF